MEPLVLPLHITWSLAWASPSCGSLTKDKLATSSFLLVVEVYSQRIWSLWPHCRTFVDCDSMKSAGGTVTPKSYLAWNQKYRLASVYNLCLQGWLLSWGCFGPHHGTFQLGHVPFPTSCSCFFLMGAHRQKVPVKWSLSLYLMRLTCFLEARERDSVSLAFSYVLSLFIKAW